MYDLKVNSTITSDTIFSIYLDGSIINGSQIQAPNRYVQNTFVSFNRVFIAQVPPSGPDRYCIFIVAHQVYLNQARLL